MLSLCALAVAPQAQAQAQTTRYYRTPTDFDKETLTIPVQASVGGRCGFASGAAPGGTVNAGSIDTTGWSQQVPFTAQCTAPWRIAVSSLNGALLTGAAPAAGYLSRAPYSVMLNVSADGGTVASTCPVATIDQAATSSTCNFNGTATTTNGLYVTRSFNLAGSYIQLSAPAFPGPEILAQGTYNDTLVVTISPAT